MITKRQYNGVENVSSVPGAVWRRNEGGTNEGEARNERRRGPERRRQIMKKDTDGNRKQGMTVRQLAALAGVSPGTVSKALNDQSDVSVRMKEYIRNLARENGYEKHIPTGGNAFSGIRLAILYTDQRSKYYSRLLMRFNERIAEENGIVFMVNTLFSDERAEELCRYFEKTRVVDGVICIAELENNLMLEKFRIPVVSCSVIPAAKTYNYDYIFINEETGIEEGIRVLAENGHRTFAYLGERHTSKRHALFRKAMDRLGIPEEDRFEVIEGTERYEKAGYILMKALLRGERIPTAICCDYDDMAVGAGAAILEEGYRIPEDFSVTAVDNSELTLMNHKVISSVDCCVEDQVDIALSLIRKRIREPGTAIQNVSLLSTFVNRDTVGPCPEGR